MVCKNILKWKKIKKHWYNIFTKARFSNVINGRIHCEFVKVKIYLNSLLLRTNIIVHKLMICMKLKDSKILDQF